LFAYALDGPAACILQDTGWQLVESKRQRQQQHVLLRLQQSLVQTLEELYAVCEGEPAMADSAVRYLEQTVHHFKQVQQLHCKGCMRLHLLNAWRRLHHVF
jgi:hypothetical protein